MTSNHETRSNASVSSAPATIEALEGRQLLSATAGPASVTATNPSGQRVPFEVAYLEFTADHHFMGVKMAQLIKAKATNPRLRSLGERIGKDQAAEIKLIQRELKNHYGISYQPMLSDQDQHTLKDLKGVTGKQYDIDQSEVFITHHSDIILESKVAQGRLPHGHVQALSQHIITEQRKEVTEFETVLGTYHKYFPHPPY